MPLKIGKHARLRAHPSDGLRFLVTRFALKGVTRAAYDHHWPALAPSADLLASFKNHPDPEAAWWEFVPAYRQEIEGSADCMALVEDLREMLQRDEVVSLLCACHRPERCHRSVLAHIIKGEPEANQLIDIKEFFPAEPTLPGL